MEHMDGALCLVVRDGKILMQKKRRGDGAAFCTLPGGGIEVGETPEEAAVRELREECCVTGIILRKLAACYFPFDGGVMMHAFHMDIGDQTPVLGFDPEKEVQDMVELRWMALEEICEQDRAFLFAHGLMGVPELFEEVVSWSNDISYPAKK